MAMPIRGDQLRWCGLFLVISTLPRSTTFSLVKNVMAEKMVKPRPRSKINMPIFFICFLFLNYNESDIISKIEVLIINDKSTLFSIVEIYFGGLVIVLHRI